jgi:hypothetical protein
LSETDFGERVAILETSIGYLSEQLEDTHRKVEEMHAKTPGPARCQAF